MINKGTLIVFFFAGLLCLGLAACDAERDPCLQPANVSVSMHFYKKAADTGTMFADTLLPALLLNPLDGPQVYMTSPAKGVSTYSLRLSPLEDVCRWYLQADSSRPDRRDTLTFRYERRLHFISNACGYTYYFNLTSVTPSGRSLGDTIHGIDSVVIADRDVNGDARKEHLKIYFHKP